LGKQYNIIIDPGHGGIDKNGNYTTAPDKMYTFSDGFTVYEGERNRVLAKKVEKSFLSFPNFPHKIFFTVHPNDPTDVSLHERVSTANEYNPKNTLFISLHNNAGGGTGKEIYTYIGQSESDKLATHIYDYSKRIYDKYGMPMRPDWTDEDPDKEAKFYVLKYTYCSAVLVETAFFDHRKNAELLFNDEFLDDVAFSITSGIMEYTYNNQ